MALRSHWGFARRVLQPCNEKAGVETEVCRFRRNWLAPVPEADDLAY